MNLVLIEVRSFQQPVSYLWGLDPNLFRISLAFSMVTNDAPFVSRIWGWYCFGSLWSGNRRSQWWKIGFFRLSFRCCNFVSCSFFLVRSIARFDVFFISTKLFCSIFVTRPSSSFLLVLIVVYLRAPMVFGLDEPALSLTFWQIKHSSSFKGLGLVTNCTILDGPGVFFDMFVLVWSFRRRRSYTFINTLNTPQ